MRDNKMWGRWEHLCEAVKLYPTKSFFMKEARAAWETRNLNTNKFQEVKRND